MADNGETGNELWVTDGTTGGTNLVADINPGANGSNPNSLVQLDDQLYFIADNGETGNELWVTDGTANGTSLLKDINPGIDSSDPADLIEFDGKLYFSADDGENGNELWVTDGTPEETNLLLDVSPGTSRVLYASNPNEVFNNNSSPRDFVEFNGKLYFIADNRYQEDGREIYSIELWETDGTTNGTSLVAELHSGIYGTGSAAMNFSRISCSNLS